MNRSPSLTALRTFEAVGRLRSIKVAAQELNVTPAAVSHQLRLLEEELRTEIFVRGGRGLTLTATGDELYRTIANAFALISDVTQKIRKREGTRVLYVDSLPSFASCWLVPRLGSFYAANPGIEVEVNTVGDLGYPSMLAKVPASVAIRVSVTEPSWPGLVAEKLFHEEMFPACSPSLLEGPVPLRKPGDLKDHTLLIVSRRLEGWPEWLMAAERIDDGAAKIDAHHGQKFDTIQLATTAAIEGMGVVMGRKPLINHYLKEGLLVEPFSLRVPSKSIYWLVSQQTPSEDPLVSAFREWITKEVLADEMMD